MYLTPTGFCRYCGAPYYPEDVGDQCWCGNKIILDVSGLTEEDLDDPPHRVTDNTGNILDPVLARLSAAQPSDWLPEPELSRAREIILALVAHGIYIYSSWEDLAADGNGWFFIRSKPLVRQSKEEIEALLSEYDTFDANIILATGLEVPSTGDTVWFLPSGRKGMVTDVMIPYFVHSYNRPKNDEIAFKAVGGGYLRQKGRARILVRDIKDGSEAYCPLHPRIVVPEGFGEWRILPGGF